MSELILGIKILFIAIGVLFVIGITMAVSDYLHNRNLKKEKKYEREIICRNCREENKVKVSYKTEFSSVTITCKKCKNEIKGNLLSGRKK